MRKAAFFLLLILLFLKSSNAASAETVQLKIEMLPWTEVNHLLPKYSKFDVLDVESGKRFHVQRRAGSNHADVQPLTAKDTRIMKQIYNGKWSWKRRAIYVIYHDQWIAASMHGMLHGAGALKNNFPGHFCIHFYGSKTHRTKSMDLAHMLMIFKAAGVLDGYLNKADPYEAVRAYIAGIKQQDKRIVSGLSLQTFAWDKILSQIDTIKIARLPLLPPEDLTEEINLEIPIELDLVQQKKGRQQFKGTLRLLRFSPIERWKIDSSDFFRQLDVQL
ncbi:hypothetical protein ACQYAD_10610 [Neobacillus sp. SM06]|uniref:hypothetical protein n=1 Tax=Neobacillus sp. SM06 TaxID=3422492 RepID=UPI003D2CF413